MEAEDKLRETVFFLSEYTTRLLGSGVHTSRVVRNSKRIGAALGVDVRISTFQKTAIITVRDDGGRAAHTEVVDIPALPISFELNSDLSALSWQAFDEHLALGELRRRYSCIVSKPRIDPMFVLILTGLANGAFCRLFGGDWNAVGIVLSSTLIGMFAKQRMQHAGWNHFIVFILAAFIASIAASSAMIFETDAETAIATSVLFLIPGVPLLNGVIDIVEGHILSGCSRIISALLLIVCIAVGLSLTLILVKDRLL